MNSSEAGMLKADTFEPYLNQVFEVRLIENGSYEAPLAALGDVLTCLRLAVIDRCERLRALENGFERRPREPFSLIFEQADPTEQRVLKQGHYALSIPGKTAFAMFVVPIAMQRRKDREAIASPADYQVVFN